MGAAWDDLDSHQQGFAVLGAIAERASAGQHTTGPQLAATLGCDLHDPSLTKALEGLREGGPWVGGPIGEPLPPLIDDKVEPDDMTPVFELTGAGVAELQSQGPSGAPT